MQEQIILKPKKTKKYEILECDGTPTGEYIEFDFEMVEYPIIIQEALQKHKKNLEWIKNQILVINKKNDFKKKGNFLSNNQELKIKAVNDYLKKDSEALDMMFGKGTTKKMLNGRKPYYRMFDDIFDSLNKIVPSLDEYVENITEDIKKNYSIKEEEKVLNED